MEKSDGEEEGPEGRTVDQPEQEPFQRLCLCTYLSELPEIGPDEKE